MQRRRLKKRFDQVASIVISVTLLWQVGPAQVLTYASPAPGLRPAAGGEVWPKLRKRT
jgi:hypothetical protein